MSSNPFTPISAHFWMNRSVHLGSAKVEYAGWYGSILELGQSGYQTEFVIESDSFMERFAEMWEIGALKQEDLPSLLEAIDQGVEE